ncbi:carbon-nitrogen hydrolase family protein [Chloroflexota bacterium]
MIPKEYQKYEQVVTVACVNFNPVWGDKEATLEKIKANIVEAAAQGSNIIIFPEDALVGATCSEENRLENEPCRMHRDNAETVPGPSTQEVACLAKEYDVYVIFGMPEQEKTNPDIRYNAVAVVGPEGILGTYRKLNIISFHRPVATLPAITEDVCFTQGSELPVWETRYGPIGIQICYDFWLHPELSRIQALKGARLIINCTASVVGPAKTEFMIQQTGARATENCVYTASANLVGEVGSHAYYGHSTIAGPAFPRLNHIYAEGGDGEEIVTATLSFEKLHRWHEVADWRKLRRSELIACEFQSLL